VVVDNDVFVPANRHKGGGKPLDDLEKGSKSHSPRYLRQGKSPGHRRGKDSPPHQSHRRKDSYSPKCNIKSH